MPGFGVGFAPAFARSRAIAPGGPIFLLAVLSGGGGAFEVPLTATAGDGTSFTVPPVALDGDGNSFNVS